jgi:hypothetical protein
MGVNLVVINGTTKLDLTADTVTADTLKKGKTAHNAAGDVITGELEGLSGVEREDNTSGGETITVKSESESEMFELALGVAMRLNSAFSGQISDEHPDIKLTRIPRNATVLPQYCFWGCNTLAITEIPASVTTIEASAFTNCTSLTSLTFKGTPTSIASWCFGGCTNLKDIYVPWSEGAVANAPWSAPNATIHYDCEV